MNPEDEKTLAIARRTRTNLEFIYQQHAQGADVYEFTQLLNSMLGMVICIREDYYKGSGGVAVSWAELEQIFSSVSDELKQKADAFSTLISSLRNAFAHNHYELVVNSNQEIAGVEVWNIRRGKREWQARFTEKELHQVADLAIGYLERKLR